jgi:hypothetical protein
MGTNDWQPRRGDSIRIRATGEAATAMKIDGTRVRVHYDPTESGQTPEEISAHAMTPVHRAPQRPPQWYELAELEPATP